ncbi:MAG: transglycosylase domain-containing protein, partial [Pseudomonadota bacterium]
MTILRFFAMAAAVVILCAVGVLLTVLFTYFKWASELPDHTSLAQYAPPVTTRIHAGDGTLIAEYARERRLFVPIKGMPDTVTEAFTSAEDKSFFDHQGVDMRGVVRATLSNVSNYLNDRRLEGASTITQQVAKNFLLSSEKSIERKAKEWILATRIESALSKEQILELYLNEIYLGLSSYGVAAAALNYFDKSLNELTLGETAYLAALPKAPNNYHPIRRKDRAIARRNWVIERMYVNGFITDAEREAGQLEELVVKPRPLGIQREEAGYFAEEARRLVYDMYGDEALYNGGLSVRTTLEPRLQRIAIKVLREGLSAYDRRHGWRGAFATVDPNTITEETFGEILSQQDVPPDIAPWVPALVLDVTAEAATIGFADGTTKGVIPLSELAWAQQALPDDALGAEVSAAWDVLARGNVVFVEPVAGEDGRVVKGRFALRQIPEVNGAITVIDPHTGRVLAMVGGFSFEMSEFNRATQAARQPGSAFKPFVYAVALEQGMSPATLVLDAPFVIDQGSGQGLWKPDNYSDRFYGPSTLRTGIERSRNVMTVRLAQEIGMQNVVSFANRFGIKEDMLPVLSMALGAG